MTSARGNSGAKATRARGPRAYTLAELLTVLSVIGVLAGMSIGVFAALPGRLAQETGAATVRALLRRARAAAIESRSQAQVTFAGSKVEARSWTPLALLRFESVPADAAGGEVTAVEARGLV